MWIIPDEKLAGGGETDLKMEKENKLISFQLNKLIRTGN